MCYFPILVLPILQTESCQSTFKKEVMLDHSYQDANELWTDYGLDFCFNDFDLVAMDNENLNLQK